MKWRAIFILFVLTPFLAAEEKPKVFSVSATMQEQMKATEASLMTLEGFVREARVAPTNESRARVKRLSRDVRGELYGVIACVITDRVHGSLTAAEDANMYHWARKIERRRTRAERSFYHKPRFERQKIDIHIGGTYR